MPVSAYLRAALLLVCAAAALFGSAGSFAIVGFWIYLAILTVVFVAAFAMLDRGLLQERMRPGGRPAPLGLRLLNVILLLHWVIAGLDRGRLHWTATVPAWLQAFGLLLVAVGYVLVFWAMLVNRFFSSVVRVFSPTGGRGSSRAGHTRSSAIPVTAPASSFWERVASRSAPGLQRHSSPPSCCHSWFIASSRRIACCRANWTAMPGMPIVCRGAWSREFGDSRGQAYERRTALECLIRIRDIMEQLR